jgi:hypothetical protein
MSKSYHTLEWKGEGSTDTKTYSVVQSPSWEANRRSADQEIPRILRNRKIYYCSHNRPLQVPILRQMTPFHTPKPYLSEIHFNIISSTLSSIEWSLFFKISNQNCVRIFQLPLRATSHFHHMLIDPIILLMKLRLRPGIRLLILHTAKFRVCTMITLYDSYGERNDNFSALLWPI